MKLSSILQLLGIQVDRTASRDAIAAGSDAARSSPFAYLLNNIAGSSVEAPNTGPEASPLQLSAEPDAPTDVGATAFDRQREGVRDFAGDESIDSQPGLTPKTVSTPFTSGSRLAGIRSGGGRQTKESADSPLAAASPSTTPVAEEGVSQPVENADLVGPAQTHTHDDAGIGPGSDTPSPLPLDSSAAHDESAGLTASGRQLEGLIGSATPVSADSAKVVSENVQGRPAAGVRQHVSNAEGTAHSQHGRGVDVAGEPGVTLSNEGSSSIDRIQPPGPDGVSNESLLNPREIAAGESEAAADDLSGHVSRPIESGATESGGVVRPVTGTPVRQAAEPVAVNGAETLRREGAAPLVESIALGAAGAFVETPEPHMLKFEPASATLAPSLLTEVELETIARVVLERLFGPIEESRLDETTLTITPDTGEQSDPQHKESGFHQIDGRIDVETAPRRERASAASFEGIRSRPAVEPQPASGSEAPLPESGADPVRLEGSSVPERPDVQRLEAQPIRASGTGLHPPVRTADPSAWLQALLRRPAEVQRMEDGTSVLRVRLDEDSNTMTVRSRSDGHNVVVSVGFSDPGLTASAESRVDEIRSALQSVFDSAVDLSFTHGDAENGRERLAAAQNGRSASHASALLDGDEPRSGDVASAPRHLYTHLAGGRHEWVG